MFPGSCSWLQSEFQLAPPMITINRQNLNIAPTFALLAIFPLFRGSDLRVRRRKSHLAIWPHCLACAGRIFPWDAGLPRPVDIEQGAGKGNWSSGPSLWRIPPGYRVEPRIQEASVQA